MAQTQQRFCPKKLLRRSTFGCVAGISGNSGFQGVDTKSRMVKPPIDDPADEMNAALAEGLRKYGMVAF